MHYMVLAVLAPVHHLVIRETNGGRPIPDHRLEKHDCILACLVCKADKPAAHDLVAAVHVGGLPWWWYMIVLVQDGSMWKIQAMQIAYIVCIICLHVDAVAKATLEVFEAEVPDASGELQ